MSEPIALTPQERSLLEELHACGNLIFLHNYSEEDRLILERLRERKLVAVGYTSLITPAKLKAHP